MEAVERVDSQCHPTVELAMSSVLSTLFIRHFFVCGVFVLSDIDHLKVMDYVFSTVTSAEEFVRHSFSNLFSFVITERMLGVVVHQERLWRHVVEELHAECVAGMTLCYNDTLRLQLSLTEETKVIDAKQKVVAPERLRVVTVENVLDDEVKAEKLPTFKVTDRDTPISSTKHSLGQESTATDIAGFPLVSLLEKYYSPKSGEKMQRQSRKYSDKQAGDQSKRSNFNRNALKDQGVLSETKLTKNEEELRLLRFSQTVFSDFI